MKKIKDLFNKYKRKFDENITFITKFQSDKINLYATQAAFFLIISAVPFLMFLLSLMIYLLPINEAEFLNFFKDSLPVSLRFWGDSILSMVYSESTISVTSIAAITTLWAASYSIYALSQGLETVYESNNKTNTLKSRILSMFYTFVFMIVLIVTMGVVIFSKPIINLIDSFVPIALRPGIQWLINILNMSDIFPLLLICISFMAMYKFLSHSKLKFRQHLPGAVFASSVWLIFSWIYAIYINNYSKISITYGSLANIVIMMLWLKFCMNIFLIGAEINVYLSSYYNKNTGE